MDLDSISGAYYVGTELLLVHNHRFLSCILCGHRYLFGVGSLRYPLFCLLVDPTSFC